MKPIHSREQNRRWIGESEQRRVGEAVQLCLHGTVERRMAMPMQIHPDRGRPVEVLLSFRIDQI